VVNEMPQHFKRTPEQQADAEVRELEELREQLVIVREKRDHAVETLRELTKPKYGVATYLVAHRALTRLAP